MTPTTKTVVRHEVVASCRDCPRTWPVSRQISGACAAHARSAGHTVVLTYAGEIHYAGVPATDRPLNLTRASLTALYAEAGRRGLDAPAGLGKGALLSLLAGGAR